jgi:hypothetical protein
MVCLMELSSHLLVDSVFDSVAVNEMQPAARLLPSIPDHSLTLFDKGFYSLGLLHAWQQGQQRHWLLPLRKGTQYEVMRNLGRDDKLVRLTASPQARKKWPGLPETLEARLLNKTVKGKPVHILTSLTDALAYPGRDIVDLYAHQLSQLPSAAPGNLPREVFAPEKQAKQFKLEGKRERSYPRVLKASKNTYPVRKKYAAHLK